MLVRRLAERECLIIGDPANQESCIVVSTSRVTQMAVSANRDVVVRTLKNAIKHLNETNQAPCQRVQEVMDKLGLTVGEKS